MYFLKIKIKFILQILIVITYFSTLDAKNMDNFNKGNQISNYFSGIILLNDNYYKDSYNYFKKLNGLEKIHNTYSVKYLFSLVNLGKITEAFHYSKKLEKENLANFESNLVIGIYHLKNQKNDLAQNYFSKLYNLNSNFVIKNFISKSLVNWSSFKNLDFNSAQQKIQEIDSKFDNLKKIQNVFLHCYYQSKKTEYFFERLTVNKDIDFSRYNYFYANYLFQKKKHVEVKKIIAQSLKLYPRNLLLNQFQYNLVNKIHRNDFDCRDLSHVVAEILYIAANALSSQDIYNFSNFYLNLSKYLNPDFHSFDTLFAENFYKEDNYHEAKKIYEKISKRGKIYSWYSAKQIAKILILQDEENKALDILSSAYKKINDKTIYQKYDYAQFLKTAEKYDDSIKLYSEIIQDIKEDHPLYPKVTDGRGVSYERIGNWVEAEKDLLASLKSNPEQAYVINYLAYSWIEKGVKIKQSLKMLEKANSLSSNDPYIIDSLRWALFKLERYKDSKNYLQNAVQLLPADPIINDHFADALWKNGNKIQARYYWNYVLKLQETEKDLKEKVKIKLISGI